VELEAVLRALVAAAIVDVPVIAARARRLAHEHAVWLAPYALGVAERRLANWTGARRAFEAALEYAPGASPVRLELATTCIALGDADAAIVHATRAHELEGDSARALGALAAALLAARRNHEALGMIERVLEIDPDDAASRSLAANIRASLRPRGGAIARIFRALLRKPRR